VLLIKYKLVTGQRLEVEWLVGQSIQCEIDGITEIRATGAELTFVLATITGIPRSKNGVQSWFGDDAKFIVSTLLDELG
jgi:hypothetical protein